MKVGHHLLGVEGLALLRGAGQSDVALSRRVEEIRALLDRLDEPPLSDTRTAHPVSTGAGYAVWASSYDSPGNVTVALEEEVVHALLAEWPPGSNVLDAGCGTGRHTAYLADHGHEITGVDTSEEMLALALAKVTGANFELADLEQLPFPKGTFDAAVCGLVLSHARDIRPGVAELARVLRPGGRLVISNPHPFATGLLDWRATVDAEDGPAVIREYPHSASDYVAAFTAAGLRIVGCYEPALTAERARAEAKAGLEEAFELALTGFPVVIVWELVAD